MTIIAIITVILFAICAFKFKNLREKFQVTFTPSARAIRSGESFVLTVKANRAAVVLRTVDSDVPVRLESASGNIGGRVITGPLGFRIVTAPEEVVSAKVAGIRTEVVDTITDDVVSSTVNFIIYPKDAVAPDSIDAPARIILDENEQRPLEIYFTPSEASGKVIVESDRPDVCDTYADGREVLLTGSRFGRAIVDLSTDLNPEACAHILVFVRKKFFIEIEGEFDEDGGDLLEMSVICPSEESFSYSMDMLMTYTLGGEFHIIKVNEGYDRFRSGERTVLRNVAETVSALRAMDVTTLGFWATNIRCDYTKYHLVVHNAYKRQGYWWKGLDHDTRDACASLVQGRSGQSKL